MKLLLCALSALRSVFLTVFLSITVVACSEGGGSGTADPLEPDISDLPDAAAEPTEIPDETPVPDAIPQSDETPEPDAVPEPEVNPQTDAVPDPDVVPEPDSTPDPEAIDLEPDLSLADVPGSSFYLQANNSARLQGPLIGDGSVSNTSIARTLPFELNSSEAGLKLLNVSIVPRGRLSWIVFTLANRSSQTKCFVTTGGYKVNDFRGEPIVDSLTFADGSVGTSGRIDTGTCIAPQSLAYMIDLVSVASSVVGSVSIDELDSLNITSYDLLEEAVEPLYYTVGNIAGQSVDIVVANRSSTNVRVTAWKGVLLDDDGFPVGILSGFEFNVLLPGSEFVLSDIGIDFTGSVSSMRVVVDFDRP